jgi:5-methylcytosine-specific restriction endonuclease McrA
MQYIHTILYFANMLLFSFYREEENERLIIKFDEYIDKIFDTQNEGLYFSRLVGFPIDIYDINSIINSFVLLYPIYDSILRIAKGENHLFQSLISKLKYKNIYVDEYDNIKKTGVINEEETHNILEKNIDNKNVVRAGMRWQVFERDEFKCVACGKSAQNGAILHVDHILPRSKGGKEEMDNYQTLCHLCNIGKSNKSDINLRKDDA